MVDRYAPGEVTVSSSYAWLYTATVERDKSLVVRAPRASHGTLFESLYVGSAFHGASSSELRVWSQP